MKRDYKAIGDWCVDAHYVTATELPESVACLQLETIRMHSGRPTAARLACLTWSRAIVTPSSRQTADLTLTK